MNLVNIEKHLYLTKLEFGFEDNTDKEESNDEEENIVGYDENQLSDI